MMNKKGFTLNEIIVTAAIVGTLTAIAVPDELKSKVNENAAFAKQSLKTAWQKMNDVKTTPSFGNPDNLWTGQSPAIGFQIDVESSETDQAYDEWMSNQHLGA